VGPGASQSCPHTARPSIKLHQRAGEVALYICTYTLHDCLFRMDQIACPLSQTQWHPYGEFFASGSIDTNLKIWDIRRKTVIQTYKGHTKGVRQIVFSPDGRWVASGGDDGVIKLWDLTMGRRACTFSNLLSQSLPN
jgi:WD40 repeat protein